MKQLLRIGTQQGLSWITMLDTVELAVNSAPVSHTIYSPFFMNYGFDPALFPDVHNLENPVDNSRTEPARAFAHRMREQWKLCHQHLQKVKDQSIAQANLDRTPHDFKPGDWVMVKMTPEERESN